MKLSVLSLVLGLFFISCNKDSQLSKPTVHEIKGKIFGSTYNVKYLGELTPGEFSVFLDQFFLDFNQEFSTYQSNSVINLFNSSPAFKKIKVSTRFIEMLKIIKAFNQKTMGAFDPTLGPVVKIWGFYQAEKKRPRPDELKRVRDQMGVDHLKWDESSLVAWKTKNGVRLDLNAFAPGWAADLVGEELIRRKINHFMVDIGGEILVKGSKGEHNWVVGIERPSVGGNHELHTAIKIKDLSIATSGNYRHFFLESGQRKSHIIDPRTGEPVTHQISSVTILAETALEADIWGTALMVLGEEGLNLAEQNGIMALLLKAQGPGKFQSIMTTSMSTYLKANEL